MQVRQLTWISEEGGDAILLISDNEYSCSAFASPCDVHVGDILQKPLTALDVTNLMISRENECSISLVDSSDIFEYKCVAEIVDVQNGIVSVGQIKINLHQRTPAYCIIGDLVDFSCMRLDVE